MLSNLNIWFEGTKTHGKENKITTTTTTKSVPLSSLIRKDSSFFFFFHFRAWNHCVNIQILKMAPISFRAIFRSNYPNLGTWIAKVREWKEMAEIRRIVITATHRSFIRRISAVFIREQKPIINIGLVMRWAYGAEAVENDCADEWRMAWTLAYFS